MTNILYRWLIILKKPANQIWTLPACWAVMAVLLAFAARLAGSMMTEGTLPDIRRETLDGLLTVIASSMLSVSTFSLSVMVSAFASASTGVTPRATELITGDENTRVAIASFIAAFIFAVIAKTALGMEYYGQNGRFILFVGTILVLLYLIATLIHWVFTLSQLGRLGSTLEKIRAKTEQALHNHYAEPDMGATWTGSLSAGSQNVLAGKTGYLTHINTASLQNITQERQTQIHIAVRPGELLLPDTVLACINGGGTQADADAVAACFVIARERTYEQDPQWGLTVLSEAAQRALSPAVNDPGTAVAVMVLMLELLTRPQPESPRRLNYDRLSIVPAQTGQWLQQSMLPIARDGAAVIEVGLTMQKVLSGIAGNSHDAELARTAITTAKLAIPHFEQGLATEHDQAALKAAFARWQ